MSSGKIAQVVGPVVDVAFATGDKLPEINNALVVYKNDERKTKIVLEVALELGDGMVRTIAMESTDGLTRGMEVLDTGRPISVPVGKETLGRVFNVLGDTIDLDQPFPEDAPRDSIHKKAPSFDGAFLLYQFSIQVLLLQTDYPGPSRYRYPYLLPE